MNKDRSARQLVLPAHEDPHHSVDLFDRNRRNEFGDYACVAPAILYSQVRERWEAYLEELRRDGE